VSEQPFVAGLRARPGVLHLGKSGGETITVRVEIPEQWDVVVVEASPETTVADVKRAAVEAILGAATPADELVIKLNGFEVLNEQVPLVDAGAKDGSIFLATYRRRRPVR
jgi:hypothetical protein